LFTPSARCALKVALPVASGLLLAACSGSSQPAATTTTQAPRSPSRTPVPPAVAVPTTVAAAQQAATQYFDLYSISTVLDFDLYSAGQYTAAYEFIAPGLRKNINEAVWVGVDQSCKNRSAGMTFVVSHGARAEGIPLVAFTVSLTGAASALSSGQVSMTYADGKWYYDPSDGWVYFGRTLPQALAGPRSGEGPAAGV
jgi:hypothetical protein